MKPLLPACAAAAVVLYAAAPNAAAQAMQTQTASATPAARPQAVRAGTVRGTITDEGGQPLVGVQVVVAGSTRGAITDAEGKYRIGLVPAGSQVVRAKRIGYAPAEVAVVVSDSGAVADFQLRNAAAQLGGVVVTGVFDARTAQEASVAITTLDTAQMKLAVPTSSADLLKKVPGVFVNSSLGEIRNIVYSRGVSAGSVEAATGYFYVSMQEDGLPVTSLTGNNYGPDYFYRADATVARVEAVRGGSASITSANAPGGIFNYRSLTGARDAAGEVRMRAGSQGDGQPYARFDVNYGGPLSSKITWNAGGFYRYDRGVRDAGYPMNVGGQVKANATYQMDNGGHVRLYGKYLDDRNGWFEFIPVTNFANPTFAPGFDANSSVLMPKLSVPVHSNLRNEDLTLDPSRLIRSQDRMVGLDVSRPIGGGWTLDNNAKYSNKDRDWQSSAVIFTSSLTDFFPYVFNGVIGSPGIYTFRDAVTGSTVATVDRSNPFAPTVTSSTLGNDDRTISSLVLAMRGEVTEVMDQLKLSKQLGSHRFTVGGFFSNAEMTQYSALGGFGQMTFEPRPRMLRIEYEGPDGKAYQVTAPNGAGTARDDDRDRATWRQLSAFVGHSWELSKKLNLDWGARTERVLAKGTNTRGTAGQSTTGGVDGDPQTLFDNTVIASYDDYRYNKTMTTFSASAGLNYLINDAFAVYVRGSRGEKTPDLEYFTNIDSRFEEQNVDPIKQKVTQVEGGVKFQRGTFRAVATPFYSYLSDIGATQVLTNTDGTLYSAPTVYNSIRTIGVELETNGTMENGLGLQAAVTLQNAKATKWQVVEPGNNGPDDDRVVDYSGGEAENNANIIANVTPNYSRGRFSSYLTWRYIGDRPANVPHAFDLPGFSQLDAGANVSIWNEVRLGLAVSNLTNNQGIMSWTPPGLLFARGSYSPAQVAASPNATFGVIPIQPRSFYLTLSRPF